MEFRVIRRYVTDTNPHSFENWSKRKENFERLSRNSQDWRPLQQKVYAEINRKPEKDQIPTYIPPIEPGELEEPVYDGDPTIQILEPLTVSKEITHKKISKIELNDRPVKVSESGWAMGKGRRKTALAIARIRERTWPFRIDEIPMALQLPEMDRLREYEPVYTTIAGHEGGPEITERKMGEFWDEDDPLRSGPPPRSHDYDDDGEDYGDEDEDDEKNAPEEFEFLPTHQLPRRAGDGIVYTKAEVERAQQLHENMTKDRFSARQRKRIESSGLDFNEDDDVSQADLAVQFSEMADQQAAPPAVIEVPEVVVIPDTHPTSPYFGSASNAPKTIQEAANQLNRAAYFVINGRPFEHYFIGSMFDREVVIQPLMMAGVLQRFDIQVYVRGSGVQSQAKAVRQAIARALCFHEPDLRPILKHTNILKSDLRQVERKKTGQPKARKKKQWSKR